MTNQSIRDFYFRTFGYVIQEGNGEQWVVYKDHWLIVIHPEHRPRIYREGCKGVYFEFEPALP